MKHDKNEIKSQIQAEALALAKEEDRSLVVAATGAGKSRIAVDYSKDIVSEKSNAKILIIVPTEKLRDENWLEEFEKWKAKTVWKRNVERSCYVSANKIKNKEYDLVILDEAHNITENNSIFFLNNKVKKSIALTATPPEDDIKKEILNHLGFKLVYNLPLDKAVELGLVSPYNITVVEVRLDDTDKYIKAGSKDKPFMQTERKQYQYMANSIRRMMFSSNPSVKKQLKFALLRRMRFIYELRSKTEVAKYLLEHVIPKDERTIIFAGGIPQAEELCEYNFHSKKKNSDDFDAFKAEKLNRLSCVNALNEGHNIPNIDNGLVTQLNSKELNLVQRVGRVVRFRENHEATIYIICAIDTQDEKWVNKALQGFDPSKITYKRFDNMKNHE